VLECGSLTGDKCPPAATCHEIVPGAGIGVCLYDKARAARNDRPVIGVMIQPLQPSNPRDAPLLKYGSMYVPASYVKFVEAAGARAAPVFYNSSLAERTALFAQLSGLILPGGHVAIINTSFSSAVYEMLDLAAAASRAGAPFPVHGTCLGSQQLSQWASRGGGGAPAEKSVLFKTDAEDLLLPIQPVDAHWAGSWLFGGAPTDAVRALQSTNSTVNLHHYGVPPAAYASGGALDTGLLRPLATSADRAGVPFVAAFEGVPPLLFSGTQWRAHRTPGAASQGHADSRRARRHPEKNAFEFGGAWNADADIGQARDL
jgi:gamma-glutamyl hydrolase